MSTDTITDSSKHLHSLQSWLDYITSLSSNDIDLGLQRVSLVFKRLALDFSNTQIITVAGTNGKGTTCALLEKAALTAGYSVAVYSSPFLLDYTEQLRINGISPDEQQHCNAFSVIETARGDVPLTSFEFTTLSILYLISQLQLNYALLEVGMGGDTDAVNVVDPDIAIITSIALDHGAWLGNSRESVGSHKAGIFRKNIPLFIGEPDPPNSVILAAKQASKTAFYQGVDFGVHEQDKKWEFYSAGKSRKSLPKPQIPLQNTATALAVIEHLKWPLNDTQVEDILLTTQLPGRCHLLAKNPHVLLDVAHNPQAAQYLRGYIENFQFDSLHLVVGMLADKDIAQCFAPFYDYEAHWYLSTLSEARGASSQFLKSVLVNQQLVVEFDTVEEAYDVALENANKNDLVVVFGSFITVSKILKKE